MRVGWLVQGGFLAAQFGTSHPTTHSSNCSTSGCATTSHGDPTDAPSPAKTHDP